MGKKWLAAAILLLPILIILAATLAYYAGYRPGSSTNEGELVTPPYAVEQLNWRYGSKVLDTYALEGHWSLVLWGCDTVSTQACAQAINEIRSLHIRLHRDTSRVRRYLLVSDDYSEELLLQLVGEDAAIRLFKGQGEQLRNLLAERVAVPLAPQGVYCVILDPNGNLMMIHHQGQFGDALYDDLRKLLRLSQIG